VALDPDERAPASGETKACTECHTTKTPLWRGGPCGPMVSSAVPISLPGTLARLRVPFSSPICAVLL
jgi:hypothetical protein